MTLPGLVLVLQPATLGYLELAPTPVLPCVYAALAAPRCATPVIEMILSVVEALIDHSQRRGPKGGTAVWNAPNQSRMLTSRTA